MKNQIAEKLKDTKLDFAAYGQLPIREDVILFVLPSKEDQENRTLLNQWEKLKYLRNHLTTIDRYIRLNKGEKVNEWNKVNPGGLSHKVLDIIGSHDNKTGGISSYFFNLQNYYDESEALYDAMEAKANIRKEDITNVLAARKNRGEKRKNRGAMRKILIKGMKSDGKGYLEVVLDEEPQAKTNAKEEATIKNADGQEQKDEPNAEQKQTDTDAKSAEDQILEAGLKKTSNIGVWIAGVTITIATIATIGAVMSKKN